MPWIVILIVGGGAFLASLALLLAAVLLRSATSPSRRRAGVWCLVGGLVALVVSATALPLWAYALLAVAVAAALVAGPARPRAALTLAGILALVAVGLHEARYHTMPRLGRAEARRVAIIGDSLTAGQGDADDARTWPSLLRDRHGVDVQELARVGETAASAAERLQSTSIDAPVVLVEIGGNDVLGGATVSAFEVGLDELLGRLRAPGRQVVMFEVPIPPAYERFGRVQRALATRHGAILVPKRALLSVIGGAGATIDSIHLTQAGHERMAAIVWGILGPALPPPERSTTHPEPPPDA